METTTPELTADQRRELYAKMEAEASELTAEQLEVALVKLGYPDHRDPEYLRRPAYEAQLRSLLQDTVTRPALNVIRERFTTTVKRKWSGSDQVSTYPAIKFADDLFICIDRQNEDGTITSLCVLNGAGEWAGGSSEIYPAETDYRRRDDGYVIRPARASFSSTMVDSTDAVRATAEQMLIAADLADLYTKRDRPYLEALIRVSERHSEIAEQERQLKQQLERALADDLENAIRGEDVVRVTLRNKKTPYVGQMFRVEQQRKSQAHKSLSFQIQVAYADEPIIFNYSAVEKIERKERGRFIEMEPRVVRESV